jgi:hypothetical protein
MLPFALKPVRLALPLLLAVLLVACEGNQQSKAPEGWRVQRSEIDFRAAINEYGKDTSLSHKLEVYRKHMAGYAGFYSFFMQADTLLPDTALALIFADFGAGQTGRLIDTVLTTYPADYPLEKEFNGLFARVEEEFPDFKRPAVVTYVAGYPEQALYTFDIDQLFMNREYVGVGLHYFMGENFPYPPDIPRYLRRHMTPQQIVPRVAFRLTDAFQPRLNPMNLPTLLDWMVFYGLKYYFMDQTLPGAHDSLKLLYTGAQLEWARKNEAAVYSKLLPYLYDKMPRNINRWLAPGPFTAGLPQESPDRLGHYFGLQIVRAYVERNGVTRLRDLMLRKDYRALFEASGYKP